MKRNFLVVDNNLAVCLMLKSWLVKKGYNAETATDVHTAKQMVRDQPYDLIVVDIKMPDIDGFTFLSWVKKFDPDILVIMMTGSADIESAIASMKSGASDYISKPIEPEHFFQKIDEAFQSQLNRQRKDFCCNEMIKPPGKVYAELLQYLDDVVDQKNHLLITGSRGSGKASIVRYLHEKGYDQSQPLMTLDLEQIESEMEASRSHTGSTAKGSLLMDRFVEARGGMLHICNAELLDLNLQTKLLGMLTRQSRSDDFVQVVISSVKEKKVLQKVLIAKFYALLEKNSVELPDIKGEKEVIDAFTNHFLKLSNFILNKEIKGLEPELKEQFYSYPWNGNIQELKSMILKAVLLTESGRIPATLASELFGKEEPRKEEKSQSISSIQKLRKENYEKEKIIEALTFAKGNKTMAASILHIDRKTLYNKMKLYKIST